LKQRGRQIAPLEVLTSPLDRTERQHAPHELNDEETEIWFAVVNSMPAEWFSPSTVPLLTQYCRHTIHAKRIAELLEQAMSSKNLVIDDYSELLKMQDRETRAITLLASKMRISQQSTISDTAKKTTHSSARKPWQD
jgi:hypothetical protein